MNAGRAVIGTLLVGLGSVFLLDTAGVLDAGQTLGDWWPLIVILLGAF
ncbi:MAG: DUF5668 domain-containing protein, partial [Acidimicrobiia bacterium]|nr:DUF5668 domain-containing protein [Acidimicrobiia bacterium]